MCAYDDLLFLRHSHQYTAKPLYNLGMQGQLRLVDDKDAAIGNNQMKTDAEKARNTASNQIRIVASAIRVRDIYVVTAI